MVRFAMFYFVHDTTNPENPSHFETELDEPPTEGETLRAGTMVYEVVSVRRADIDVVRRAGPGQSPP